ncbi:MAG: hypothetical protein AAFY88_21790, partial [Acidobacteriota bacterium]
MIAVRFEAVTDARRSVHIEDTLYDEVIRWRATVDGDRNRKRRAALAELNDRREGVVAGDEGSIVAAAGEECGVA